ncbi:YaaW family protein [Megasphaera paucivorans]|uniref:Uncharacterized protein YaaW, UPF0174 family n=1 Tax=Megasphaera paucivorans TaxID=349095 RepID=A0A1G9UA21_9FIRM|nr:ubiquinol-cytochrome C chaperone family protein [Megasphaera paucivorans]SDM56385.1 Uncharacterized protein YaaW, UPF0174 family [Megasphaera paucivorans]
MYDQDMDVLDKMSNEELNVLVQLLIDKGTISEMLSIDERYKRYAPDHKQYLDKIKEEINLMGGNTFANLLRGGEGIPYHEILRDVCDKLKVPFNKNADLSRIEQCLLEKVLEKTWEEMSDVEKEELMKSLGGNFNAQGALASGVLISIFRAGGFASYQLALIITNGIAKLIVNRGLSLAANATLARALSIFSGPIGIALSAIWMISDIAGPAYRVTIPATIYIAALRYSKNQEALQNFRL